MRPTHPTEGWCGTYRNLVFDYQKVLHDQNVFWKVYVPALGLHKATGQMRVVRRAFMNQR